MHVACVKCVISEVHAGCVVYVVHANIAGFIIGKIEESMYFPVEVAVSYAIL